MNQETILLAAQVVALAAFGVVVGYLATSLSPTAGVAAIVLGLVLLAGPTVEVAARRL